MIKSEPKIRVGICEGLQEISGIFNTPFVVAGVVLRGGFHARFSGALIHWEAFPDIAPSYMATPTPMASIVAREIKAENKLNGNFTINEIVIGKGFHWERRQSQTFAGSLILLADAAGIVVVNEIDVENYLGVVVASEMSARAPLEFLKAQAIVARSWTLAALRSKEKNENQELGSPDAPPDAPEVFIRWYGRDKHKLYDFCADDHCQRYHGLERIPVRCSVDAVQETRGVFLVNTNDAPYDARYHKACGGFTERFDVAWHAGGAPYLIAVNDSAHSRPFIDSEDSARLWLTSSPDAYCNVTNKELLAELLPNFDQETPDFFRWQVSYSRGELGVLLQDKLVMDIGTLQDIIPLQRGASGRIYRLLIAGSKRRLIVGKELEIRRLLSYSHLYSSAFVVEKRGAAYLPDEFVFHGGGWGHGVGLCQIGAANMAAQGFSTTAILKHYFPLANLKKLY